MAIKICLDAGHYSKYNRSPANGNYYESTMAWKLHILLKKYLEQYGFEVIQTRSNQAKDMEVYKRGQVAKGCSLFLSLHSNAVGNGVNESVDYPIIYHPINGTGKEIAERLAACIAEVMGTAQSGKIATRKSGSNDYYGVIRGAVSVGVAGLILEHSFHTNTRSTNWLLYDSNLDRLAKAEADVIAAHYGVKMPTQATQSQPATNVLYRVQVGAYSKTDNAEKQLAKVKYAGFDAIIVKVDNLYKIQVGAFSKKENADNMLYKVKMAGFDAFITTKGGTAVPASATVKKSIETIAKEVLAGKWGNGENRKKRIAEAGYDYAAVQAKVNALLK